MSINDFVPIWNIYGLNTDPFSTTPILVKGGLIPPKSFTGREFELNQLQNSFRSTGGSRMIVFGTQGVGKTTFVNFARINAIKHNFFTPFQEIRADVDWTSNDFILNTISAIYSSLIKVQKPKKEIIELIAKLKPVCDLYEKEDATYSINIPGIGGGYGKTRTINKPELNSSFLIELFYEIVKTLINSGFREVILHYNNLDNFDEEEEKIKSLFNKIRDFIQTPNVHFVFVGSPITASIINSIPRVTNIFNDTPIHLNPLSIEDVKKIIHARIKYLTVKGMNVFDPVTDESVETLYSLHNGNLRAILNSLCTAVKEITKEKPILLTNNLLKSVLSKIAQQRFSSKLTPVVQEVIIEMLKHKETTNKQVSEKLNKKAQNISKYFSILKANQCIYLTKSDGREKYYAVAEWIKWLMLDSSKGFQSQLLQFH